MCDCMRIISRTRENIFIGCCCWCGCRHCFCCCAAVGLTNHESVPRLERSALICTILDDMMHIQFDCWCKGNQTQRYHCEKKTAKRSVLKLAPIWINCEIVVHFNQCSDFVDFFHAISQPPTSHRFMIVFSARQLLCYWCCNLLNHTTVFCIVCHVTFQFFEIQSVCIWHG